jgi:glucuronate isomerase
MQSFASVLHPDRLLPAEPTTRDIARRLYEASRGLPLVCPHGHYDPAALADNRWLADPVAELVTKDHYLLRLMYSHGVPMESLGVRPAGDAEAEVDGRAVWRELARHYHLFRGTPSKLWLDHTLSEVFGVPEALGPQTADAVYEQLCTRLAGDEFRPRAFLDRCGVRFLATTDAALDPLRSHAALRESEWPGQVVPTFRPDDVVDPDRSGFREHLATLSEVTGSDTSTWRGYLEALRTRRACFIAAGATATDHGHPSALTCDLSENDAADLFGRLMAGKTGPGDAERFRGQMLMEMAAMSMDDGLVLQLHTGSWRDHNPALARRFGPDMGADIPKAAD